jgi:hypothetical protein
MLKDILKRHMQQEAKQARYAVEPLCRYTVVPLYLFPLTGLIENIFYFCTIIPDR